MTLWHNALKLNKGIYKTTEHLSDAEILKKQIREQSNEIISTLSVYYSRTPSASAEIAHHHSESAPSVIASGLNSVIASEMKQSLPHSYHSNINFYLPEKSICLMLLLDKIVVLKTFIFLAKEHNFFNEEKHQILTAACVHLSESIQTELSGADIFSHPLFNSVSAPSAEVVPPSLGGPTSSVIASENIYPRAKRGGEQSLGGSASKYSASASDEVVPPSLGGPTSSVIASE
ncbi:MAG: hypothetical protein AAB851_01735, partial [Patescibacteria group bacterium]